MELFVKFHFWMYIVVVVVLVIKGMVHGHDSDFDNITNNACIFINALLLAWSWGVAW